MTFQTFPSNPAVHIRIQPNERNKSRVQLILRTYPGITIVLILLNQIALSDFPYWNNMTVQTFPSNSGAYPTKPNERNKSSSLDLLDKVPKLQ